MKIIILIVAILFILFWILAGIYLINGLWKLVFTPDDKEIECTDYPERNLFDDETTKSEY